MASAEMSAAEAMSAEAMTAEVMVMEATVMAAVTEAMMTVAEPMETAAKEAAEATAEVREAVRASAWSQEDGGDDASPRGCGRRHSSRWRQYAPVRLGNSLSSRLDRSSWHQWHRRQCLPGSPPTCRRRCGSSGRLSPQGTLLGT